MATNKDLVVCKHSPAEQVDDDEVMMVVEERNLLDNDDIESEVTELEFENDEGVNNRTIEENLPEASTSDSVVEFLPLEKAKSPVWQFFGFPARSDEYVEKNKRCRKKVFCTLCKNPLNYTGSTTDMIVHLQYQHLAE